jgi:hypothetical protein
MVYKVQGSISHTSEGTDTGCGSLNACARNTISKSHEASASGIEICTTPVGSGGE